MFSHWSPTVRHLELDRPRHAGSFHHTILGPLWVPAFLHLRAFEELEEFILTNELSWTEENRLKGSHAGSDEVRTSMCQVL